MPNWGEVLTEIQGVGKQNPLDSVRRKYLAIMNRYTERNVIAYYSGWLQRNVGGTAIDDNDKNALMQAVHGLDKTKGLDIILHTPGGQIAATESIVHYLKSLFGNDIRAFIPQLAMSAGTMIALSCKEIVMGKESNIGPIDPQFGGVSCIGVIEEF
jgi:ClpP class serine protease